MDSPREVKPGQKKPFKAREFLQFIHDNISEVLKQLPPQSGLFTKKTQHPLVKVKQDLGTLFTMLDIEKKARERGGREEKDLDAEYSEKMEEVSMKAIAMASRTQSSDRFSREMAEIFRLSQQNQNPEINYFYEFAKDKFAQYTGEKKDYKQSLQDKYDFLMNLKTPIIAFYAKYKPGVSGGIDELTGIIQSIDKAKLNKASGQLAVYKAFHQCCNLLAEKNAQVLINRKPEAENIYKMATSSLEKLTKVPTEEHTVDSFELITQQMENNSRDKKNRPPQPFPRRVPAPNPSAPVLITPNGEIPQSAESSPRRPPAILPQSASPSAVSEHSPSEPKVPPRSSSLPQAPARSSSRQKTELQDLQTNSQEETKDPGPDKDSSGYLPK